tara:strand:- start:4177 stop:5445 length:1269 start_codon:yes stop_codon:yes gene_type:complete
MNFFQKLFSKEVQKKSIGSGIITIGEPINNAFAFDGQKEDEILINEGYVSNSDIYAIVKKICEVSSDVPFIVKQQTPDGWEIDEDSSLNDLLRKPNELQTEKEFRFNSMNYLLNTGDVFWKKLTSSFDLVTELELFESNLVELFLDPRGDVYKCQYFRNNTIIENYSIEEIIHTMYLNPSSWGIQSKRGLSPLQAAYNTLKSSNNRSVASASMLENGGASNVISSGSDLVMTEDEREELQKNSDKILGGADKFGKNIVSTANLSVNSLGMSSQQMQMLEGGTMDLRTLCNIFGVQSAMFNDQAAATLDNMKIADKKLYTDAVIPNNNKLISAYDPIVKAYSAYENKTLKICQDTSDIDTLQEDKKLKAEKDKINIEAITSVLTSPISNESKIATLVEVMGLDEDKAEMIVGNEIVDNNNETV